jgi:hypothetical protein
MLCSPLLPLSSTPFGFPVKIAFISQVLHHDWAPTPEDMMMPINNKNDGLTFHNKVSRNQATIGRNAPILISGSHSSPRSPPRAEMNAVFQLCKKNMWTSVLNCVRNNPRIATTSMTMQNNIATTIIHQAITSKGDTAPRAKVVEEILNVTPEAAAIRNGYGSLPLHVIAQRNTKMDAMTKERLIRKLLAACPRALIQQGGVGLRTPLHIIFTGTLHSMFF